MSEQKKWLSHYVDAIPLEARRKKTSMYVIALEAWRRGIEVTFYNYIEDNKVQIRYQLSYNGRSHNFHSSKGDKVSEEAYGICNNKSLTAAYLEKGKVPIPQGQRFNKEINDDQIIQYARSLKYPLVIKPTNGSAGKGVIANISDEEELKEALEYVRYQLKLPEVIVERYIQGEEIRIYVLDGKVLGAANRRPANIIGNGENTIQELIRIKNKERKEIPHLYFRPIRIDREVQHSINMAGYDLNSIPKKGRRIYLRKISNVSKGGEPIDVTDQLTDAVKEIAVKAVQVVPGLTQCGVDMIVDPTMKSGVVLELNTKAGLGSHLFPIEGVSKDIPKEIVSFYFPETVNFNTSNSNIFFDFKSIMDSLQSRSSSKVVLKSPKQLTLKSKKVVFDRSLNQREKKWLKKQADIEDIFGSVQINNKKETELIIATFNNDELDPFISKVLGKFYGCTILSEEVYNKPVKVGFEIIDKLNSMTIGHLEDELSVLKKELIQLEKERDRYEKRMRQIKESRSWHLMKPIRRLFASFMKAVQKDKE
ncbi:ATP-grasp domain-containing protein [Halalkalibacter sp. APA_J-10(15)]|uniref:ATP-binding protein n=1 Tax=Halalkalibacter sp. APA_J-10(15) TaxID=2933805 RepID=UPI001FF1CACA|nr:ATP-grasp domain-containing protein [Halalkalibacter sp. APA_J-10(15)]MCK0470261.1 ATP-grasp domain-containing protein [Halalkalibacter sp. APA_J-10(15)]